MASPSFRWVLDKAVELVAASAACRVSRPGRFCAAPAAAAGRASRAPAGRVSPISSTSYANFIDPQIAEAVVAVLHHNGFDVYVPPGQRGCGMAALAHGDVETAREAAEHNLRLLAEAAREGFTIVCSEPTAALMLRHDYLDLVDDPDAQLVAAQTVEFTAFLCGPAPARPAADRLSATDLALGHHVPCHLKALDHSPSWLAGPALLSLIPGMRVHTIDVSCSGMAGTFGLRTENYETSLDAGRRMLDELQRPRVLFGSTECGTCRMQMEDGAGKRTLHPAQYLALAYGLMPAVGRRLDEPIRELVLR